MNLKEFASKQAQARESVSKWKEFPSKKQLPNACIPKECEKALLQLTNTFTFYVSTNKEYVVVVLYFSKSNTYEYYLVNTSTLEMEQYNGIRECKEHASIK